MNATRRLSIAALAVACLHLVFGAIVRITGSGMGCGDHWPKCYGHWFPPFDRPDLIVEVSHRYLASILTFTVLAMALVAWRHRRIAGIGGKGGAMRSAFGALAAVLSAAILGGVTVKMGNAPWATVAHWLVAMALLAMVATTSIRCGALGGASSLVQRGSQRARRSGLAAAFLAILAVALGGLTAKYPGAAVGCTTVPLCGPNPNVESASVHVQLTHRTLAVLLVLHLIGVVMMVRKRRAEEAPVVIRAAYVALGMVLLQLVVASAMVLFHLPPVLRSLHEATGVGIWLSCFTLAYLARRASNVTPPEPATLPDPSPKGGISIVREPVAAPSVIAAGETIVASAPVAEAAVIEDVAEVAVADEVAIADEVAVVEEAAARDEELPPPLAIVAEKIVGITELLEEESGPSVAALPQDETLEEAAAADDAADGAAIVAELILAIEDAAKEAAKEAALERAEVLAREAALAVLLSEAQSPAAAEEIVEEEGDPSVAALPQDDAIESVLPQDDAVESALLQDALIESAPPQDDTLLEELDWEPRRAESEELDEFSIAALEAEVVALEAAQVEDVQPALVEATVVEPEPAVVLEPAIVAEAVVVETPIPAEPADQITADASIVAPPVKAPKLSPLTAPTMAVLVARGADFL